MASIALVTDSTTGVPADYAAEHGLRVVPLYVHIGEETYRDGVDITPTEFYKLLPNCETLPTTSQPSVGDFEQVFAELISQGAEGIITIHLSSGISGTVNSAQLAAERFKDVRIKVVDSQCASAGALLAVETGVRVAERGASFDETLAAIEHVLEQQKLVFAVDTLEYLYKGGRIGGAAALLGSVLQFKPILYFNEGIIDALERVRTSRKALTRIAEIMREWMGPDTPVEAVIITADCPDRAKTLQEILPKYVQAQRTRVFDLTPVLGTHVGNGTLGLCCCPVSALALEDQ